MGEIERNRLKTTDHYITYEDYHQFCSLTRLVHVESGSTGSVDLVRHHLMDALGILPIWLSKVKMMIHQWMIHGLPSGKRLHNHGKSPCLMGKSTISMAIFNSYVSYYQRVHIATRLIFRQTLQLGASDHGGLFNNPAAETAWPCMAWFPYAVLICIQTCMYIYIYM